MRRSVFPLSLTAPLGSVVVVGLWLGQISLALAKTDNPEEWVPYQPHPKWGWFADSSTPAASVKEEQPSDTPVALPNHSDPTSVQHPDWDSVYSPESWNTQNEVADASPSSAESSTVAADEEKSGEESSVCLSETSESSLLEQSDSSSDLQGEVQSMEEYFQRYGRIYAGSELHSSTPPQTDSSLASSDQPNTDAMEKHEEELPNAQDESGETSLETSEDQSNFSAKKSDDENDENDEDAKEDEAEEKEDWEATEELESSEDAEKTREPQENTFPGEQGEISTEEPTAGASVNEERMDSNPSEEREDIPQQEGAQEAPPHEQAEPATPPEEQSPGDAPETPDNSSEAFSPWGYEPGYDRVEAEYTPPSEPGTPFQTEQNRNPSEKNTSASKALAEQNDLTPSDESLPLDRYEYPEQSEQDSLPQPNDSESSWSDIPGQEPNAGNQPATSRYEWWLENPDTWSETTSPQSPDSGDQPSSPGQSSDSSPSNYLEGEELKGWKTLDREGDSIPSGTDDLENNDGETSSGLDSEAAQQTGSSLSPAPEESSSVHPSLLEGIARSLLRLVEPWRKTVSGLLDISAAAEGFTKTFPIGEETLRQEGAASLPAETTAR